MKKNTLAGFHVSCIGDARAYSYTQSRKGSTISDLIAKHVLSSIDPSFFEYSWLERGTDDRQYCAPGVDLPLVAITRSKSGEYPEYHTSLDDLENVVTPEGLNGGYWAVWHCLEAIERNKKYRVLVLCEPQLGKRGLYSKDSPNYLTTKATLMKDFISLCDGETSLLEIAERLNVPIWELYDIVRTLEVQQLISSELQN